MKDLLILTLYIFAAACVPLIGFFSEYLSNNFGLWFFSLGMVFSLIMLILYMMNRHSLFLFYGSVFILGDLSSVLFI
jgi:hypothetical protein